MQAEIVLLISVGTAYDLAIMQLWTKLRMYDLTTYFASKFIALLFVTILKKH